MKKRLEAWALWTEKFGWSFALSKPTLNTVKTFTAHGKVVRLVECGPDEVVVPKSAAAVVRAAVAYARRFPNDGYGEPAHVNLLRAVERMQKGRRG